MIYPYYEEGAIDGVERRRQRPKDSEKQNKKICDEEQPTFPQGVILHKDTGFQGYEPEGVITQQPKKKPRGGELTRVEKNQNFIFSSTRIIVEHVISGIKRCRILKDVFRNTKVQSDDLAMAICCALHNFRTECRTQATNTSRDSDVTRKAVPPGTVIFPDCGSDTQSGKITALQVVCNRFGIEKAEQLFPLLLSRFMLIAPHSF